MTLGIPKTCLKDNYSKMNMVIQKYFTCEGIFHMIYQYYFRLLLHFIGKHLLDLPFLLFRSLGKMADKIQAKPESSDTSIFHHGLIKLLVMEELKKLNKDWATFLFLSGYDVDVLTPRRKPKSKKKTPKNDKELRAETNVGLEVEVQPIVEPMEVEIEKSRLINCRR